jgi:DnaJ-class molecular chaperone
MYAVLGVGRTTSSAAIRKAFKRLSLEYHPDKNRAEGAADMFQRIKLAYDVSSHLLLLA